MSDEKVLRNVALPINGWLGAGEAMEIEISIPMDCRSRSLHIPGSSAEALILSRVRHEKFERVAQIGCTVFGGFGLDIDPLHGRALRAGSKVYMTFENRWASFIQLHGSLVVEMEAVEEADDEES